MEFFDEIKLIDKKELNAETLPVFRGNEEYFGKSSLFMSKFYATDKLADPAHIKWILNKRLLNDPQKNDIIISLQLGLNDLTKQYNHAGITKKKNWRHRFMPSKPGFQSLVKIYLFM